VAVVVRVLWESHLHQLQLLMVEMVALERFQISPDLIFIMQVAAAAVLTDQVELAAQMEQVD
jgi:hypothetical protein